MTGGEPVQHGPVGVPVVVVPVAEHGVVEHGPAGHARQLLDERDVRRGVAGDGPGDLDDLDEALPALPEHLREVQDVLVRHGIGDHGGAVVVRLARARAHALDREAAEPGVHALVQKTGHLGAFGRRGAPRLRGLEPHDVGHQGCRRHVVQAVDALRRALEGVEVLGDRLPVPLHAHLHGLEGDRFVARHGQHRTVAVVGLDGGEAEAAVAEHDGGDAVPPGAGAPGVPADLGVVVGVQVDESRRDDVAFGVDGPRGPARRPPPELGDAAVLDPDISPVTRDPGSVDDRAAADVDVVIADDPSPLACSRSEYRPLAGPSRRAAAIPPVSIPGML